MQLQTLCFKFKGSVLGRVLFKIIIKRLSVGIESALFEFAHDIKLGGGTIFLEGTINIQNYLHKMKKWSGIQSKLNKDYCKILNSGRNNQWHKYKMGKSWLISSAAEMDLGLYWIKIKHESTMSNCYWKKKAIGGESLSIL